MTVINIWCGAVTHDSFWVRGKVTGSVVRLAVATNEDMTDPLWFGPAPPTPDGIASIEASELQPNTLYHYAFEVDNELDASMKGQARTFEVPGKPFSYTFWFGSCAGSQEPSAVSNHVVFDTIREHNPLFGVHLGDLHYRNINEDDQEKYRKAYDDVLAAERQQNLYRHVPICYMWDNHDFGPNNSHKGSPGRDAACLTYRERVPHYPLPEGEGAKAIYQTFVVGRIRFILTDVRADADDPLIPDSPHKRKFSSAQFRWLINLLETSNEPLIIWGMTIPWIADPEEKKDLWGVYSYERDDIAKIIYENNLSDRILMISGDMHALAADDGTNNKWGGFRVLHAAPIDTNGSEKGGPYTYGPFHTNLESNQFGLVNIHDPGGIDPITVTFSGRRWGATSDTQIIFMQWTVPSINVPHHTDEKFEIQVSPDGENVWTTVAFTNDKEFEIEGLSAHSTWYIRVRAWDETLNSWTDWSEPVSGTTK